MTTFERMTCIFLRNEFHVSDVFSKCELYWAVRKAFIEV